MRKYLTPIIVITMLALLTVGNSSCKEWGIPDYTVTVHFSDNVTGEPAAGTHTYKELTKINLSYKFIDLPEGQNNYPDVFLGNERLTGSIPPNPRADYSNGEGYFHLYTHVEMYVGIVDIRDSIWNLEYTYVDNTTGTAEIVFSGTTQTEGTFTDSRGYTGTWKNEYNRLLLNYDNWVAQSVQGSISPKYMGCAFFDAGDENGEGSWILRRD